MFDSIGRRGKVKTLSRTRWVVSWSATGLLVVGSIGALDYLSSAPAAEDDAVEAPKDVTFKQSLPPPPPPPPPPLARAPKSTTKPQKQVITKKVVQQVIKDPDPTPIPRKPEKDDDTTPTPEIELDFAGGEGGEGGVIGGVLGGVVGGELGSNTFGNANIQEVDVNSIQKIKHVPPVYPPLAKRGQIEGSVLVEVTCSHDGKVTNVAWISGNVIFKDAVNAAVYQWQFAPRQISFKFRQPLNFSLKK